MIESLSKSMWLLAADPLFWVPLVLSTVVLLLLIGLVLFDGFELGVGLLLPLIEEDERSRLMDALAPWRGANESWLLLVLGLSMAAFPFAWSLLFANLYPALMFLVLGAVLRSVAYEFRARAPMREHAFWQYLFTLGSLLGAVGFGLLLAGYATGQRLHGALYGFASLVTLGVLASFLLLGASWTLLWAQGALRVRVSRLGKTAARWTAAGMVAVAFLLGLTSPAVFYRWTHGDNLWVAVTGWVVMLSVFVILEIQFRHVSRGGFGRVWRSPLVLTLMVLTLMIFALIYSFFPFVVLDELTVWDATASANSLLFVMAVTVVALPVLLIFNVLGYWRLFARRRTQVAAQVSKQVSTPVSTTGSPSV
jgi:cytochrome d ubiquinol oxidase subunit II